MLHSTSIYICRTNKVWNEPPPQSMQSCRLLVRHNSLSLVDLYAAGFDETPPSVIPSGCRCSPWHHLGVSKAPWHTKIRCQREQHHPHYPALEESWSVLFLLSTRMISGMRSDKMWLTLGECWWSWTMIPQERRPYTAYQSWPSGLSAS